ncbi:MogA/MoaB family molybdenum cofactor biosynthesis protein [Cryobacterium breve]|uniref:MogA/MoaB family molybdenum cofactor biosynthesis protein n=1 Tax=Cryobacterium breve TaxID=1259258 RepID=UPI0032B21DA9
MTTNTPTDATPRVAQIIVASTRAAAGIYPDRTGPVIEAWLLDRGWTVDAVHVVPDGDRVGQALGAAIAAHCDLVITTGGTGVSPHDETPEQTLPHLDRLIPGLAEEAPPPGRSIHSPGPALARLRRRRSRPHRGREPARLDRRRARRPRRARRRSPPPHRSGSTASTTPPEPPPPRPAARPATPPGDVTSEISPTRGIR